MTIVSFSMSLPDSVMDSKPSQYGSVSNLLIFFNIALYLSN